MHDKAFEAQCAAVSVHGNNLWSSQRCNLILFSLAFGSFCIGTSEFASMGMLQLFSRSLGIDIPTATDAITAYAFGVVIGAPAVTLAAARLNRRSLLICLMIVFAIGNVLSGLAANLTMFALARFISGIPQGAYFGAGAVVASYVVGPGKGGRAFALVMTGLTIATIVGSPLATFLGQHLGWRATYFTVAGIATLALLCLVVFVPRTSALDGGAVAQQLAALRKPQVWLTMIVAAIGVASIFAVYTFIGPLVTVTSRLSPAWIPASLAIFGLGMTVGNVVGGHVADRYPAAGLVAGFAAALGVMMILAIFGADPWVQMPAMFGVGAAMMSAIPTLQVRLNRFAPEAPTLMGAMNLASLNTANAIGAWAGGMTVAAGHGFLGAVWAGFGLTLLGLIVFGLAQINARRKQATKPQHDVVALN